MTSFPSLPSSLTPTTSGIGIGIGSPSSAASASIPPTPKPKTPRAFIIVVCESVPTSVSGNAVSTPSFFSVETHVARYSRLTWWHMPVEGGTTLNPLNAFPAHLRSEYLSLLRLISSLSLIFAESRFPKESTWIEWSTTRSTLMDGFIVFGLMPFFFTTSLIAARSTTAGIPVKSCISIRETLNGISSLLSDFPAFHPATISSIFPPSSLPAFLRADPTNIATENGNSEMSTFPSLSSSFSEK